MPKMEYWANQVYIFESDKILPKSGGWLDQTNKFSECIKILRMVSNFYDKKTKAQ